METNMAMDWRQYKSDKDYSIVEVPIVVAGNEINDYTFGISAEGAETGYGTLSSGLTFPKCSYNSNTSKDFLIKSFVPLSMCLCLIEFMLCFLQC